MVRLLCILLALGGCRSGSSKKEDDAARSKANATSIHDAAQAVSDAAPVVSKTGSLSGPCPASLTGRDLAPGFRVERMRPAARPPLPVPDPCLWIVRIDPTLYRPVLLTAAKHGGAKPIPRWVAKHKLVAGINASMFLPNNHSTGMAVSGALVDNGRDNAKFGAFFAFDPKRSEDAPVKMFGRGCPEFDLPRLRAGYRGIVQNYRLLDCDGKAIAWKDPKIYSAAAVGIDVAGNVVLLHLRAPYLMRTFTKIITAPGLRLTAAMYVEGGPEATLVVDVGGAKHTVVGSYETGFTESTANTVPWDIPNVIGFRRRAKGGTTGTQ